MQDRRKFLNLDKTRNSKNTRTHGYNCGGFALGTYTWVEVGFETTEEALHDLFRDFDGFIRKIENAEEVNENEFIVLFRISEEGDEFGDFHFLKRTDEGKWIHKPGAEPVAEFEGDPFKVAWSEEVRYHGEIVMLAVDRILY